jgi:hypothetical protein
VATFLFKAEEWIMEIDDPILTTDPKNFELGEGTATVVEA